MQPPLREVEEPNCADVATLPPGVDRCAFVREHCESGSLLHYPQIYYCHVAPHGTVATAAMVVSGICMRQCRRTGGWAAGMAVGCGARQQEIKLRVSIEFTALV